MGLGQQQAGPPLAGSPPPVVGGLRQFGDGRGRGTHQTVEQLFEIEGRQTIVLQGEQIECYLVLMIELIGRQEGGEAGDARQVGAVDAGSVTLFLGGVQARRQVEHCLQAPSTKT